MNGHCTVVSWPMLHGAVWPMAELGCSVAGRNTQQEWCCDFGETVEAMWSS
jgi:hypothetical protein